MQIINATPKGENAVDIIIDTLAPSGESRIEIEHRLEPSQSVIEMIAAGDEIRVRVL